MSALELSRLVHLARVAALAPLMGAAILFTDTGAANAASSAPIAKLQATRLSGPAPLAVMFDATETTAPGDLDAFRDVTYTFDFGDDRNLKWEHSGQPRNSQSGGPLAAHVFDNPGTYTIRLRAEIPGGSSSEASVVINVADPATVFPDENTICVSATGSFAGCPKGALRETQPPRTYANKRVLLNRGETFGTISVNRNNDGMIIGSYGEGPKPIVQSVFINSGRLNDKSADEVTIMDLSISNGIQHSGSGSRYLFYRNDLTQAGGDNKIEIGGALDYLAERNPLIPFTNPREIFIIDNVIRGEPSTKSKPHLNLSGTGAYIAVMGNDISRAQEHTVRFFSLNKGLIAHNAIRGIAHSSPGQPSIRHAIKIHSGGLIPYSDAWSDARGQWATRFLVIADNILGDTENNGSWTLAVAPQNNLDSTIEGIEDVIIERNRFVRGPHTNTEGHFIGRRITTRANTRVDGGRPNLSIGTPAASFPREWIGPYHIR
jgi:hypothetical protein